MKSISSRVKTLPVGLLGLQRIIARVRSLIRRAAHSPNPQVTIDSIQIDTASRNVSVEGEPVSLTALEYRLIEYLALRRGTVVTRTELYDHLFAEEDLRETDRASPELIV